MICDWHSRADLVSMAESGILSTSSDSELESSLKMRKKIKIKSCLICQSTLRPLKQGSGKSFNTLKASLKLREKAGMDINTKINQGIIEIEEGNTDLLRWHKNCYSSFTSRKNIKMFSKIERQQSSQDVPQFKSFSLRKKTFDLKACVFCQRRSNIMKHVVTQTFLFY